MEIFVNAILFYGGILLIIKSSISLIKKLIEYAKGKENSLYWESVGIFLGMMLIRGSYYI